MNYLHLEKRCIKGRDLKELFINGVFCSGNKLVAKESFLPSENRNEGEMVPERQDSTSLYLCERTRSWFYLLSD